MVIRREECSLSKEVTDYQPWVKFDPSETSTDGKANSSEPLSRVECIEKKQHLMRIVYFEKERSSHAWQIKAKHSVAHWNRSDAISLINRCEQVPLNRLRRCFRRVIEEEKIGRTADRRDALSIEQDKYVTYRFSYSTVCLIFVKTRKGTIQYIYTNYIYIERTSERVRETLRAKKRNVWTLKITSINTIQVEFEFFSVAFAIGRKNMLVKRAIKTGGNDMTRPRERTCTWPFDSDFEIA